MREDPTDKPNYARAKMFGNKPSIVSIVEAQRRKERFDKWMAELEEDSTKRKAIQAERNKKYQEAERREKAVKELQDIYYASGFRVPLMPSHSYDNLQDIAENTEPAVEIDNQIPPSPKHPPSAKK